MSLCAASRAKPPCDPRPVRHPTKCGECILGDHPMSTHRRWYTPVRCMPRYALRIHCLSVRPFRALNPQEVSHGGGSSSLSAPSTQQRSKSPMLLPVSKCATLTKARLHCGVVLLYANHQLAQPAELQAKPSLPLCATTYSIYLYRQSWTLLAHYWHALLRPVNHLALRPTLIKLSSH